MSVRESEEPGRRSAGGLAVRRRALAWPRDREFRILSIDGGGIRGIFPAAFLAGVEERYLGDASVAQYFDLIAGTSTGGMLAPGLGSGLTAGDVRDLYVNRGCEVFPPWDGDVWSTMARRMGDFFQLFKYRYSRDALARLARDTFGDRKFGESQVRMCIPSADGRHGEPYIFQDAASSRFSDGCFRIHGESCLGYRSCSDFLPSLGRCGLCICRWWSVANDPIMVALVDALTCFDLPRHSVRILSIGCGSSAWVVDQPKLHGGVIAWRGVIEAAMQLQSLNVRGQAGLLIGRDRLVRVDPPTDAEPIGLDDYRRAVRELVPAAESIVDRISDRIVETFFGEKSPMYHPIQYPE